MKHLAIIIALLATPATAWDGRGEYPDGDNCSENCVDPEPTPEPEPEPSPPEDADMWNGRDL